MGRLALHWQILIAMVIGAAVGILLNSFAGTRVSREPVELTGGALQPQGLARPVAVPVGSVWILDTPSQVLIQISRRVPESERFETRRVVVRGPVAATEENWPDVPPQVDPAAPIPRLVVPTLGTLQEQDPLAFALFKTYGRSLARRVGDTAELLGGLFLRMLKMVSVPLIITSLITGVTGLGRADRLGPMFGRTMLYYLVTSLLAIVTGLLMVNLIRPGVEDRPRLAAAETEAVAADAPQSGKGLGTVMFEQLESLIPPNPFQAAAEGNFLSIIAFSIAFAIFTILVGGATATLISNIAEAGFEVMMRMTMAIIYLAPFGVLFLMLAATASQGFDVFASLGWYMLAVASALALHAGVTLPLILKFIARRSPLDYVRAMSPALLTAFSSASSNGTLPLTMNCAEERAGVSNRVTSFVLPLGATINMDGTALYEAVAVLFIAQYSGIELSLAQQIIVAFTALLASVGAAGIPHAGLVMMVIILQAVGLPTESQGIILAVDRVLDMARTSVNVWSDACGCAVVSRFEAQT